MIRGERMNKKLRHHELKQKLLAAEKEIERLKKAEQQYHERHKEYEALYINAKRSQQLYLSLLESSADAIAVFDLEGKVNFLSPSFTKIFGWTLEEAKGKRIPFLHASESNATKSFFQELVGLSIYNVYKSTSLVTV